MERGQYPGGGAVLIRQASTPAGNAGRAPLRHRCHCLCGRRTGALNVHCSLRRARSEEAMFHYGKRNVALLHSITPITRASRSTAFRTARRGCFLVQPLMRLPSWHGSESPSPGYTGRRERLKVAYLDQSHNEGRSANCLRVEVRFCDESGSSPRQTTKSANKRPRAPQKRRVGPAALVSTTLSS
jgi:hypothetical protein